MSWWWRDQSSRSQPSLSKNGEAPEPSLSYKEELPAKRLQTQTPKSDIAQEDERDPDLLALLKELQLETGDKVRISKDRSDSPPPSNVPAPDDISPDSLYPREIHCRSALDYAMFCQSFGGQFVNVYRYGSLRSCSNHWQDFWLCMRTRKWSGEARAQAIQDHYRKKSIKYKTGPSSEDIWEVRMEPLRNAFQGDLEKLEQEIQDWEENNPGVQNPYIIRPKRPTRV